MKIKILLSIILLASLELKAQEPFGCVAEAYLFQYNDVYGINLASGHSFPVAQDITEGNINAVAYNPSDGYIWGYISSPSSAVVRVGNDFNTDIYQIEGYRSAYVGAISAEGIFYSKSGSTSYDVVDLNPQSQDYLTVIRTGTLSQNIRIADWAFNSADGFLYSAGIGSNNLYRIDPTTSEVETIGEIPALSGFNYTYGAVYFDVDGNFYISANQTGAIYQVKAVQDLKPGDTMSSGIFSYGPASAANDGARCPTAPVPQEICGNGIDDDGDSLIDCDDPSCSEYEECKQELISGGSEGGLESNSRLSQKIAARNFTRAKDPAAYPAVFGPALPVLDASMSSSANKKSLQLEDLVPIGILNESVAYESSPEDLVQITNATDVYAVDYFKGDNSMASVLALKTNNGVYEHSKFICDRLLGAELNSVSTIYINEQPMIRSIIYRPNGSREFVLSFSARIEGEGMVIESHWNLDKYTADETYYNFQIWAGSINDLMTLSEGILGLVDAQVPIKEYLVSEAPYVYVKRARYQEGLLSLELMNNDFSSEITVEGGMRSTETNSETHYATTIELEPYTNYIELETGSFFDLGFRITSDRNGTPDDLFVSDGPWGYDNSAANTVVLDYNVTQNEESYEGYNVERTVLLEASTSEYVSAYRALTPRFEAVDLSSYNTFSFTAAGKGALEITLIKESVTNWEDQVHAEVLLDSESQRYNLSHDDFINQAGESLTWEDVKLIVFTMRSESDAVESKTMKVGDIVFENISTSSVEYLALSSNDFIAYPNPADKLIQLQLNTIVQTAVSVKLMDYTGRLHYDQKTVVQGGSNIIELPIATLPEGQYIAVAILENGERKVRPITILH